MKTKFKNLFIILLMLIILLYACQKNENNVLSSQDKTLLGEMKTSYENARTYNDSLIVLDKNISPEVYAYCDSAFHKNIDMFDSLHHMYSHHNAHDDHYHDGMGMHMMSNMMGMHHDDWTDGHHKAEHDMMDELITNHNNMVH